MRIQGGTGNVGIGTSNPLYKLQVYNGSNGTTVGFGGTARGIRIDNDGTFSSGRSTIFGVDNSFYGSYQPLSIEASSLALNAVTAGNVGIGTTTPGSKLHVAGGFVKVSGTDTDQYFLEGERTGTSTTLRIYDNSSTVYYDSYANMIFRANQNGGSGGYIGLFGGGVRMNTSTPSTTGGFTNTTLNIKQLADGLFGGGLHIEENATTSLAYFGFDGNTFRIGTSYRTTGDYRPISFATSGEERVRIANNGNVGIGTNNPGSKLHVSAGDASLALFGPNTSFNGSLYVGASPNTIGSVTAQVISTDGNLHLDPGSVKNTYINYYSQTSTFINPAGGNVGIGTTNPGYKLDVNGNTNVTGTLTATVKSFIIDHPTKEGKKLQYGVLEGPEHSVYVRGRLTNENTIVLPDHWHALVDEDTITVNLTSIGKKQDLWVEEVNAHEIKIGSENEINCYYTVFAERKDIEKLVTEFDK
jgi:hypothetical protein